MASVLVAYASKYGSTREVAEAIAARLRAHNLEADVYAASDVRSLHGYDAVVLGVALYYFKALLNGRRFLARHRDDLSGKPLAVFGMGPIEDTEEQYKGAREHLDKSLAEAHIQPPVAVTVFGGAWAPERARFPEKLMMKRFPATDLRDWKAIESWADSLPEALGVEVVVQQSR